MLIQEHFAKARGEKKHPGSSGKELLISELFDSYNFQFTLFKVICFKVVQH